MIHCFSFGKNMGVDLKFGQVTPGFAGDPENAQVGFLKHLLPYYISRARMGNVGCMGFENARRSA